MTAPQLGFAVLAARDRAAGTARCAGGRGPSLLPGPAWVAEIDGELADTAAFCAAYDVPMAVSANCVVVAARRAGQTTLAACVVLATTRADVNGLVRRHLGARKASFAPQDVAVAESGMEFGGITPVGLPADWPVLIDPEVEAAEFVVIGSGIRGSKLAVPGSVLAALPAAEVLEGLGQPLPDEPAPPGRPGPVRAPDDSDVGWGERPGDRPTTTAATSRTAPRTGAATSAVRTGRPASSCRARTGPVPDPMPCCARSRSRISSSSSTWVGSAGPGSSPRLRRSMIALIGRTTTK